MIRPLRFPQITKDRAALLALAAAPLVYFYLALSGQLVLCQGDCPIQNLPYRVLAANLLADGHLPLWNPYIFGGMPLLGAMQGGLLLPLNWFFLLFSAPVAMNLAVISTYALAGTGAYLFMRRTGASIAGAFVTGLVWQWSGFLVAQIGHINIIQTACLLPWVLWAIEGYAMTRRRFWAALVAVLVALQAFAGHPQMLSYSLLLTAVYLGYQAWKAPARRRAYLLSLLMSVIGLALAAVQILPALELMRNSLRATIDYEFFSSFSLPRAFLPTFIAPYLWGGGHGQLFRAPYVGPDYYGEYAGYVGLAALTLALMALLVKRDAQTKFWSVAALICLALALGRYLPFELNRLVYYVPVLNLFRVPARHLMEVNLALAVLAGHAVSAIAKIRRERRTALIAATVCGGLVVLSLMAVTLWRPALFRLGREAPVSVLRAPELFLPILLAFISAWVLWRFVRGQRGATLLLIAFIALDLGLWGQTSGWRLSPSPDSNWFQEPAVVSYLHQNLNPLEPSRILTLAQSFNADEASVGGQFAAGPVGVAIQPDIYMMHGIQNAAGYDGFGLARYSRLASDMKLWGEVVDPERSLSEGREFDLLGVRYLVATRPRPQAEIRQSSVATRTIGSYAFSEKNLNVTPLTPRARLTFITPSITADRVALITSLNWSAEAAEGETIGRVKLLTKENRTLDFALRAGIETAEWSHDHLQRLGSVRHGRASVAESWTVEEGSGSYQAHNYLATFTLPERATIIGGEIEGSDIGRAPQLSLNLFALSLIDESQGETVPLHREWLNRRPAAATASSQPKVMPARWRAVAEFDEAVIYENTRHLPRVWLATEAITQPSEISLQVIRTGRLPDGSAWDPRRTALLESAPPVNLAGPHEAANQASIVRYEPNRIDVATRCEVPSILVLSENHYPGWRATVDGREVETLRVDYNLRGVALPPGEHTVSFRYLPASLLMGLLISLVSAAALVCWLSWPLIRARLLARAERHGARD